MSALDQLKPTVKRNVIDLVKEAGVDVSDWSNVKGGSSRASVNPKYCYEWSFIEPGKLVVLNLWHSDLKEDAKTGEIYHTLNFKKRAFKQHKDIWKRRDAKLDNAIQVAYTQRLPIKVILLDGGKRGIEDTKPSRPKSRRLDTVCWAVTDYNHQTGECRLVRGAPAERFVDQFSLPQKQDSKPERVTVVSLGYTRDSKIRAGARNRANGKCELCGDSGFIMADGAIYLETHHVVPLAEGGTDSIDNVVALCPNDHRKAHHGANKLEIKDRLQRFLKVQGSVARLHIK